MAEYDIAYGQELMGTVIDKEYSLKTKSELLSHCPEGIILDLGCGTGQLSELAKGGQTIVQMERSEVAAKIASENQSPTVIADAGKIPLADKSVDAVVCADSLEHFEADSALLEMNRVLKRGGVHWQ